MKTNKKIDARKLKLDRETLQTLHTSELDNVIGGDGEQAAADSFPCWTVNNCPSPA